MTERSLTLIEQSLLVATFFRGELLDTEIWTSNSDQIIVLSLYCTSDISVEDCLKRFDRRSSVAGLYDANGNLVEAIARRYAILIDLVKRQPSLIQGRGNLNRPADPTYTSCRLTTEGIVYAQSVFRLFPEHPHFPNWPDRRSSKAAN